MKTTLNCIKYATALLMLNFSAGYNSGVYAQATFENRPGLEYDRMIIRMSITPGDFDGDEDLDLIIASNLLFDQVFVTDYYLNNGDATFTKVQDVPFIESSEKPAVADVDLDGDLDIVLNGRVTSELNSCLLYLNDGLGNFTPVHSNNFPKVRSGGADFFNYDNDGLPDLIITGYIPPIGNISVIYRNLGSGNFIEVPNQFLNGKRDSTIAVADVNGDGNDDLIISGNDGPAYHGTHLFLNNEGSLSEPKRISRLSRTKMEFGDFDNDNDQDLVIVGEQYGSTSTFFEFHRNDGTGQFTIESNPLFIQVWQAPLVSSDFDADGDLDLFVGGFNNISGYNGSMIYYNDGSGKFTQRVDFAPIRQGAAAVGNFDGKGLDDVLLIADAYKTTGDSQLYINTTVVNFDPVVSNTTISGEMLVGKTAVGKYQYSDPEGMPDASQYKWFRADDTLGSNSIEIIDETSTSYLLKDQDAGKFISFEVLPFDGENYGEIGKSLWFGPIVVPLPDLFLTGNFAQIHPNSEPVSENNTFFGQLYRNNEILNSFSLENHGTKNLQVDSIRIDGVDKSDFSLTPLSKNIIVPGEQTEFIIKFSPLGIGNRTAEVIIVSNDEEQSPFTFLINGKGLNSPPIILTTEINEFFENEESVAVDLNANNGDGGAEDEGLEYSLSGGDDAHLFEINAQNGQLSFLGVPDYEKPGDLDKDNIYQVNIAVNDGQVDENITVKDFAIKVVNVDEWPIASCFDRLLVTLGEDGIARITVSDINDGSTDDMGVEEISIFPSEFNCSNIGDNEVILTVKDSGGNISTCTTIVEVIDDKQPSIGSLMTIELDNDPGECSAVAEISLPLVVENCTLDSIVGTRSDNLTLQDAFPLGETIIKWQAFDANNNKSEMVEQLVIVTDSEIPVISAVGNIEVNSNEDGCGALIDIVPPTVINNCGDAVILGIRTDGKSLQDAFPVGTTGIQWIANDLNQNKAKPVTQTVTVNDIRPGNIVIKGPDGPQEIGSEIKVSASFSDDNISLATWKVFDGNQIVQETTIPVIGSESGYTWENLPAGVYTIILELKDHCGNAVETSWKYAVLYDPNGGFVTGGGWIESPQGALTGSEVTGKAHFGFNAKYKSGKNSLAEVDGSTNFQFKAGDLNFKSTAHENMSLVVSGGFKATYKGDGSINGAGTYKFMVTIIDAENSGNYTNDLFRIKIWDNQGVVYDNSIGAEDNADPSTIVAGGSVVIHKPKGGNSGKTMMIQEKSLETEEIFTVYPNPMEENALIHFKVESSSVGKLGIFDLNGREVFRVFEGEVQAGIDYKIEIEKKNLMKGVYIYRLVLNSGEVFQKQLLVN